MPKPAINEAAFNTWMLFYREHLNDCVKEMPEQYAYSTAQLPGILARMEEAFRRGTYNHTNSPAIQRTCKSLGLKYTRKTIEEFLRRC